jgi:rfaE bifunctional protein nucleotidyltransferase chain/domain
VNKILNQSSAPDLQKYYKKTNKKIILTGGCFDVLHSGHLKFLKSAKTKGDILIVLLESDKNIKLKKGNNRPINSQKIRSIVLSNIKDVDHVIQLKGMTKSQEYAKLIVQINPDVIVVTEGDKYISRRKEQCEMVGAKLEVIKKFISPSTSELITQYKNG